jgi:hypothetical protein
MPVPLSASSCDYIRMHSLVERLLPTGRREEANAERGAAMVELALSISILLMLLVGTITAALAFSANNSVENAAREGSRYGATLPIDSISFATWAGDVRTVTRAAAQGDLDTTVPGQFICVALVDGVGGVTDQWLTDTGGVVATGNGECFSDGRPDGELRVQVVTEREATIQAVLFSMDVTISAPAGARYER